MKISDQFRQRLDLHVSHGDAFLFGESVLGFEYIIKLYALGLLGLLEKQQEQPEFKKIIATLNRASGPGDWANQVHNIVNGPLSKYFDPSAHEFRNELTKGPSREWLDETFSETHELLKKLGLTNEKQKVRNTLSCCFQDLAFIRNKTKAHGAQSAQIQIEAVPHAFRIVDNLLANSLLLNELNWVFLKRNRSGKNAVIWFGKKIEEISSSLENNVDIEDNDGSLALITPKDIGEIKNLNAINEILRKIPCDLFFCDVSRNIFIGNGSFNLENQESEYLNYVCGSTTFKKVKETREPSFFQQLGSSQTASLSLRSANDLITNAPEELPKYVDRNSLESNIVRVLKNKDLPKIITLTGQGGIGKTSLVLNIIARHKLSESFFYALWFSSRDIDFLDNNAVSVKQDVYTLGDMAVRFKEAILEMEHDHPLKECKPKEFMKRYLYDEPNALPALLILDNFETVENENEIFEWFLNNTRGQHKILITSRQKKFTGDYNIKIEGMTLSEGYDLIDKHSALIGLEASLLEKHKKSVYEKSSGHPFIMRVMLGVIKQENKIGSHEKVISKNILEALFDRSWNDLHQDSRFLFCLLSSWASPVLKTTLESAVTELIAERQFKLDEAVEQLSGHSLIVIHNSDEENEKYDLAATARNFGKNKLKTYPAIEKINELKEILQLFGPVSPGSLSVSFKNRANLFLSNYRQKILKKNDSFEGLRVYTNLAFKHNFLLESSLNLIKEIIFINHGVKQDELQQILKEINLKIIESEDPDISESTKSAAYISYAESLEKSNPNEAISVLVNALSNGEFSEERATELIISSNKIIKNSNNSSYGFLNREKVRALFGKYIELSLGKSPEKNPRFCSSFLWLLISAGLKKEYGELRDSAQALHSNNQLIMNFK